MDIIIERDGAPLTVTLTRYTVLFLLTVLFEFSRVGKSPEGSSSGGPLIATLTRCLFAPLDFHLTAKVRIWP